MPRARGVSAKHAQRILDAIVAVKAAQVERDLAITAALKAGASTREVAAVCGLSFQQVANIGHANGWPTEQILNRRADAQRQLEEWRAWLDQAVTDVMLRAESERAADPFAD